MEKKRLTLFTLGFGVMILLVVLFFARGSVRQTDHIHLPDDSSDPQGSGDGFGEGDSQLSVVEITPDTVQQAIATMSRPTVYSRTVSVTIFWGTDSRTTDTQVAVDGEFTRLDTTMADGSVRHLLSDGETTYIWYDQERSYSAFPSGSFTQDEEQRLPTYEDILLLPVEEIAAAVYGEYEGVYCICVLTTEDADGYDTAYWISVDTGLLVAAVTRQNGETVYQMQSLTLDTAADSSRFTLPDGTVLGE